MVEAEAEAERADILMKTRAYQLLVEKAQREKELAEKEQEKMGATWGMGVFLQLWWSCAHLLAWSPHIPTFFLNLEKGKWGRNGKLIHLQPLKKLACV